jgi:hypothetical protein
MRTLFITFLLYTSATFSQIDPILESDNDKKTILPKKKKLQTLFSEEKITIDGNLEETIWSKAEIATDFISFRPDNGNPIPNSKKTEVKIVYDNNAIYIGAILLDEEPDKIMREFANRDNFGSADFFGVFINGFNDGQQDFRFFVTASNGQLDRQATDNDDDDFSWDAIWDSKAVITDKGWSVEMKIPYAALRFSSEKKQTWGINFIREVGRERQRYSWNFIDNKIGTVIQQAGILEGIENIKTPTRLFFLPYSSYYLNGNAENKTKGTIKLGMDIKYGINDAFTLDAILIPDFGQTVLDQKILNLGPFEQQFNENRAFFTEGLDLFSKGGLFYSRRIGGTPIISKNDLQNALPPDFEVSEYPDKINLLNAMKISGRTKKGLGIGFLNAVTEKASALIRDTISGDTYKGVVEPLANYNILVFDQRFRKNSSVSFINTNVTRNGNFRDANVSALVWDLKNKANKYQLSGNFEYSHIYDLEKKEGIKSNIEFNETEGKYRYGLGSTILSEGFDINDLGINFENNYYNFYGNANYRILEPTKTFNTFFLFTNVYSEFQKNTGKPKVFNFDISTNISNKNNDNFGCGIIANPIEVYDYYEPRKEGRFFLRPENFGEYIFISTNYNKKFALDLVVESKIFNENDRTRFDIQFAPRYRFNNKLNFVYETRFTRENNNKGYVDETAADIIFANRNTVSFSNNLTSKYSINSQMNFNLSAIHYWAYSENKNFFLLQQNGRLLDYIGTVPDQDFSTWIFDLNYTWWFAPGSVISVLYRNNSLNFTRDINKNYGQNLTNLLNNNVLNNNFSISLRYFIDYNQAKNWF